MKPQKSILILTFFIALTMAFVVKWSSGIPGRTGSPGETTCTACHGGGNGTTIVSISANPSFISNQYVPGTTYTIDVTVANNSYTLFGFGCEILDASSFTNAGNMTTALSGVQFLNASNGRKNAVHTTPKSGTGSTSFSFVWTAPTTTNSIVIYAAGNAVNGNGTTTGDQVGSTTLTLSANINNISNFSFKNSMQIFPNPASKLVTIQLEYYQSPVHAQIELWNLQGTKITTLLQIPIQYGSNIFHCFIPETISNGLYILKVKTTNEEYLTSKMLIVKK